MRRILALALFGLILVPRAAHAGAETWEVLAPHLVQQTATTTGPIAPSIDVSAYGANNIAVVAQGSGAATGAWSVNLEASVDQSSWTVVGNHGTADGDGIIKWFTAKPALYYRFNVVSLTLGGATKIVLTFLGIR